MNFVSTYITLSNLVSFLEAWRADGGKQHCPSSVYQAREAIAAIGTEQVNSCLEYHGYRLFVDGNDAVITFGPSPEHCIRLAFEIEESVESLFADYFKEREGAQPTSIGAPKEWTEEEIAEAKSRIDNIKGLNGKL